MRLAGRNRSPALCHLARVAAFFRLVEQRRRQRTDARGVLERRYGAIVWLPQ